MAIHKIGSQVTLNPGLNEKRPNPLNVIKKGYVDYSGSRAGGIPLDATNVAYHYIIEIAHGLPANLFKNIGTTVVVDNFDWMDAVTPDDLSERTMSNVKPWPAGGLLFSDGTNTFWFRKSFVLSSDYLALIYSIRRTAGSLTINVSPGSVQWQILSADSSFQGGGYGGGVEPLDSHYYYYDRENFDADGVQTDYQSYRNQYIGTEWYWEPNNAISDI